MNILTNRLKQSFTVFLILTLIFALFPGAVGAEEQEEDKNYATLVDEAIKDAVIYMDENGVSSEWEAIGINRAGYKVPESYEEFFHSRIESQVINQERFKITDIERLAMTAQVIGLDPRDIDGVNLIEKLYNSDDIRTQDSMTRQGNNGPIFALIAFDSGGYAVPEDARWTREKLVDYLLDQQLENGAWPLAGTYESIDITSMALIALSNYKDNSRVEKAINEAASYLSTQQGDEGGFDVSKHGGVSSESTSQLIIGLTAAGKDPLGEDFTKNGNNLLDHLLTFANEDGGFKHVQEDESSNLMGTEQAIQALVAYKLYAENDEKLYDFTDLEEGQEIPESDSSEEKTVELEIDKETEVSSKDIIKVKNSKTEIVLPDNLPNETKLTISEPDESKSPSKDNELNLAGDWFDFSFEGTEDFEGTYELTLGVGEEVDINEAGVYHFDETRQEWELVKGNLNHEDQTITVTVNQFSSYGVFTKDVTEEEKEESEESDGDDDSTKKDDQLEPEEKQKDNEQSEGTNEEGSPEEDATVNNGGEELETDNGTKKTKKDDNGTTNPKENKDENTTEAVSTTESPNEDGEKLPETATDSYNFLIIGLVILSLGLLLFGIRKKVVTRK